MLWPVLTATGLTCLVVLWLVSFYGNVRQHRFYVTLTSYIGWLFPFCIVFLLPIDLTSTLYRRRCAEADPEADPSACPDPPLVLVSEQFLFDFWTTIYWTSFVLTWAVIPLMTSYVRSGMFSAVDKVKDSLKENIIYYLVAGLVGIAFIVYIAFAKGLTGQALLSFLIAMANVWGLILIVVFLGHGLVEVPRDLWKRADYHRHLRNLQYRAPGMKEAANDAEIEFYDVANDVAAVARRVPETDPLRPRVERLLAKCPVALSDRNLGQTTSAAIGSGVVTEAQLVALHVRLKSAVRARDRREAQWNNLLREAFFLEDMVESERNPERMLVTAASRSGSVPSWKMSLDWWWHLKFRPVLQKGLAVCCGLMSVALIWSEMTFQIQKPMLTILGLLFHIPGISYEWIEAMSIIAITYMCACAYSSLFKVRVFDIYALVPNHHTDEGSLLFVAAYLCRLTFPLCYNFLNLLTDQDDTMFVAIMGKVDLFPLLGGFQVYVPLSIGVICIFTFFHFHTRALAACGFGDFFAGDDATEGPIVMEGKGYIDQARAAAERIQRNGSPAGGAGGGYGYSSRGDRDRDRDTDRLLQDAEERRLPTLGRSGSASTSSGSQDRPSLSSRIQGLFAPRPVQPGKKTAGAGAGAGAGSATELPDFGDPDLESDNIESMLARRTSTITGPPAIAGRKQGVPVSSFAVAEDDDDEDYDY